MAEMGMIELLNPISAKIYSSCGSILFIAYLGHRIVHRTTLEFPSKLNCSTRNRAPRVTSLRQNRVSGKNNTLLNSCPPTTSSSLLHTVEAKEHLAPCGPSRHHPPPLVSGAEMYVCHTAAAADAAMTSSHGIP